MGKIKVLDDNVINKIAAGEVIENPSSAVKELVENSIDAKSTRISVEIDQAGMGLIRIVDNGEGMTKEDALLAIERHATSKLKDENDLYSLTTLGFRGEALPSISAVSKFHLRTCARNGQIGTSIKIEGGKIIGIYDDNISPGTIIEVRNLFYNVPARKKFIRSLHAEKLTMNQIFIKLALSRPDIDFCLIDSGKEIYRLPKNNTALDRIGCLFGKDFISDLIPISYDSAKIKLNGFVSHPQLCRNTRSGQYLMINNRVVQSLQVSQAIQRSYGTLLPAGRFPIFFFYLDIEPESIDVNVHPTKREIKFSNPSKIEQIFSLAVSDALKKSKLVFDIKEQNDELKKINLSYNIPRFSNVTPLPNAEIKQTGFFSKPEPKTDKNPDSAGMKQDTFHNNISHNDDEFIQQLDAIINMDKKIENDSQSGIGKIGSEEEIETCPDIFIQKSDFIKVVGQIGNCFIVAQNYEGLIVIDQHAAHERINYEKILNGIKENSSDSQSLMFPITYHTDLIKKKLLLKKIGILNKAGIRIYEFGSDTFIIDSLPDYISQSAIIAVLDDIIEESGNSASESIENWQIKLAKMLACKGSVKASDKLEPEELQRLVNDLFQTQVPYTCPHGRPTVLRMTYEQLRHYFKRE